jgi:acetyl-CoA synthetase
MTTNIQQTFDFLNQQEPVWNPNKTLIENANIQLFMNKHKIPTIEELHGKSIQNPEWFYESLLEEFDILWQEPYQQLLNTEKGAPFAKWFIGGKTNLHYYTIEKQISQGRGNTVALIWEGENGDTIAFTYNELNEKINDLAAALTSLGVSKGDRIGIYLPPIPEAPISLFACAKIGAIVIPVFSGYGAEAVASRLNDGEAKVLITADGFFRRGKIVKMKEEADRAVELAPTVQQVIIVNRFNRNISIHPNRDYWYEELIGNHSSHEPETEFVDSDHPFMIMYTSGTTGRPKGTVHTHTGFPLKSAIDLYFCFDIKRTDRIFWQTDFGWMMGPWLFLGAAVHGATVVLYEGSPDFPHEGRLWELIKRHQVSIFGISPTLIRSLMVKDVEVPNLLSLRILGSTGEPWNPTAWLWFLEKVGNGRCPIINYSGGTEVSGGILGTYPIFPLKPCGFHGPIPGMAASVVNERGEKVEHTVGDLTIRAPFLGMTKSFWNDDQRYVKAYWSKWEGIWAHGDFAAVDQHGFWYLLGRSDDTMKVAGKRIGPSEIEAAVTAHEAVKEAAAIGIPHPVKGEVPVIFAVLHGHEDSHSDLEQELLAYAARSLGKALKPNKVHIVSELPYTQSGKIARRVIKSSYLGEPLGDISTLKNRESLKEIAKRGKGIEYIG